MREEPSIIVLFSILEKGTHWMSHGWLLLRREDNDDERSSYP